MLFLIMGASGSGKPSTLTGLKQLACIGLTTLRLSTKLGIVHEVRHYVALGGQDIYSGWRSCLRDHKAALAIDRRINRMMLGNFADHKSCGGGIWELCIDVGQDPGSTTPWKARRLCFCYAEATRVPSLLT